MIARSDGPDGPAQVLPYKGLQIELNCSSCLLLAPGFVGRTRIFVDGIESAQAFARCYPLQNIAFQQLLFRSIAGNLICEMPRNDRHAVRVSNDDVCRIGRNAPTGYRQVGRVVNPT